MKVNISKVIDYLIRYIYFIFTFLVKLLIGLSAVYVWLNEPDLMIKNIVTIFLSCFFLFILYVEDIYKNQ